MAGGFYYLLQECGTLNTAIGSSIGPVVIGSVFYESGPNICWEVINSEPGPAYTVDIDILTPVTDCSDPICLATTPTTTPTETLTPTPTPTEPTTPTPTATPTLSPTVTPTYNNQCDVCSGSGWLPYDANTCYRINITGATPPSTIVTAEPSGGYSEYSRYGSYFYEPGFDICGTGSTYGLVTTEVVWANSGQTTTDGPMNRSSIWDVPGPSAQPPYNTWLGFSTCLSGITETKTYYVGIAADNDWRFILDGQTILDTTEPPAPYDNSTLAFIFWHVYPVTIGAGNHTLQVWGLNRASVAGFGCEIYDASLSTLTGATSINDLNIIFSTSGQSAFDLVQEIGQPPSSSGYTCPTSAYTYSVCSGNCVQVEFCDSSITPTPTPTLTPTPTYIPDCSLSGTISLVPPPSTATPTPTTTKTPTPTQTPTSTVVTYPITITQPLGEFGSLCPSSISGWDVDVYARLFFTNASGLPEEKLVTFGPGSGPFQSPQIGNAKQGTSATVRSYVLDTSVSPFEYCGKIYQSYVSEGGSDLALSPLLIQNPTGQTGQEVYAEYTFTVNGARTFDNYAREVFTGVTPTQTPTQTLTQTPTQTPTQTTTMTPTQTPTPMSGNNFFVTNNSTSACITDIQPAFFIVDVGSFPVCSGQDLEGLHGAYSGTISVSVTTSVQINVVLNVNSLTVDCFTTSTSGSNNLTATINSGDLIEFIVSDGACV